ncbi:MAG: putative xanthine dehydrogenase subunit A [Chloroflexi bacterium]|nr:putative xanthine dehydrogenase subunit A [Chloroflexota bacterium]
MRDILEKITQWAERGESVALATVIQTWGSSPRPVGADMAISGSGEITGSVSGGCVEGAVVEAALDVLESGHPRLLHFGVTDQTAWRVGLSCGGEIEVFVRPLAVENIQIWQEADKEGKAVATVTVIDGPPNLLGGEIVLPENEGAPAVGSLGPALAHQAWESAQYALADGRPKRIQLETHPIEFFINIELPPPTLIVVGGGHIAIPLFRQAKTLGYTTILVDPRRLFASQARFPHVDKCLPSWPEKAFSKININSSTAIATLTHDPKIDDPALEIALKSQAFYVGALGSRKTHKARQQRLLKAGLSTTQLERLHAPIGLNLGGRSPEEIALAIMAEIVQARNKRDE